MRMPPLPPSNLIVCPFCQNNDGAMMEPVTIIRWFCNVCSKIFEVNMEVVSEPSRPNSSSHEDLKRKASSNGCERVDGSVLRDCDGYYSPED